MKKLRFRQKVNEFKNGFYQGKRYEKILAVSIANGFILEFIYLTISALLITVVLFFYSNIVFYCILLLICLNVLLISCNRLLVQNKIASIITSIFSKFTIKLIFRLSKYGFVITKKDWKKIKKLDRKLYNDMWKNNYYQGYCYYYSRSLALYLKDAKLMYCSIEKDGIDISHAVILKDGVVFDTNLRIHCDLNEYLEDNNAKVFCIYSSNEYGKKSFFDDIRENLINYCKNNSVYCNPQ